jgi:hypothetical protein
VLQENRVDPLIRALLQPSDPETGGPEFRVYAVTRNPSSPTAQSLRDVGNGNNITVVEGNLDVPESITKIFEAAKSDGGMWGVFAVLAFPGLGADASGEERQGKVYFQIYQIWMSRITTDILFLVQMLADLAVQFGVLAFIYSSVMRFGPKYEDGLSCRIEQNPY